jgi:hypothetical protein
MEPYDEYKQVLEEIYTLRALEHMYSRRLTALWPQLTEWQKEQITTSTDEKRRKLSGVK